MYKIPDNIIIIISKFLDKLEISGIHIKEAILYGSYANGSYNEWSDIDLALVSDNFSGSRFYDWDLLRDAKLSVSYDLSPMPYRPEDFTPDNLFVKEIIKTGIRIK
jgi:predicted nucleotidyltransferase